MFEAIKNYFNKVVEEGRIERTQKLESFNDPIANEISWESVVRRNSFYVNRKFYQNKNGEISFNPTIVPIFFSLLFIAIGYYSMYIFAFYKIPFWHFFYHPINETTHFMNLLIQEGLFGDMLLGLLFGSVLFILGAISLYFTFSPIVFKVQEAAYLKGFSFAKQESIPFSKIHAVQLIADADTEGLTNYEMNLVLKSKERTHVYSHVRKKALRDDAAKLSQFLCVPIWDMI